MKKDVKFGETQTRGSSQKPVVTIFPTGVTKTSNGGDGAF